MANSKIREKKFGNKYWFVSAYHLKERTYEKIKENVQKTTTAISKTTKINEDHIGFLRWRAKTEFSETAKEGDQIIIRLSNSNKTCSFIHPPSTILKIEVIKGYTYFYHDDRGSEESKVSWAKFQAYLKTIDLEKNITTRSKTILENDVKKLKPLWKKRQ